MKNLTPLVLLLPLSSVIVAVKLPSSFTKCERKNSECLTKAIENAISQLNKPMKEVGLPNFEPLEIPSLVIGAGSGAVAFEQNYKDVKVSGFTKLKCSNAEFTSNNKILVINYTIPKMTLEFEYEISGRILLLPIAGKGPGLITLDGLNNSLTFKLDEYKKKSKSHLKVIETEFIMDPELLYIKLDNLFNGDKALGDGINQVMNDNWREIFADVKPGYEEAFGKIFHSVFNSLLAKVPVSDLFSDV